MTPKTPQKRRHRARCQKDQVLHLRLCRLHCFRFPLAVPFPTPWHPKRHDGLLQLHWRHAIKHGPTDLQQAQHNGTLRGHSWPLILHHLRTPSRPGREVENIGQESKNRKNRREAIFLPQVFVQYTRLRCNRSSKYLYEFEINNKLYTEHDIHKKNPTKKARCQKDTTYVH